MKVLLKSWSLPTKPNHYFKKTWGVLLYASCFISLNANGQIANYVNNGGFEQCGNCANYIGGSLLAKYWTAPDSVNFSYIMYSELPPGGQIPQIGFTWQWPKSGNNYIICTTYLLNDSVSQLGYPRNVLKQNLQAGKTYCVKFYCNISNASSYAIDGLGAYFGSDDIDTITQLNKPLSFLTPQIKNFGNIVRDTLNWVPITGTFAATGVEKYLILGNFKSNTSIDTLMINPTSLPSIFTDVLFDDVSCIDLDLPPYAGPDIYLIPGDSAFIGRQPDVGINEACTWYQSPNLSIPFDTVAGMYVKPIMTTTYVVRQEICGLIRWDTVVVYKSGLGIQNSTLNNQNLELYPVPAQNELNLKWSSEALEKEFTKAEIYNNLGQTVMETELNYTNKQATISVKHLPAGVYTLRLKNLNSESVTKRFVKG